MDRPEMREITFHAKLRAHERDVPQYVLRLFQDRRAFVAQGRRDANDELTNYHIVRVDDYEYYVAVERGQVAITFIHVENPYSWMKNRLLNFDHMYKQIRSLDVHRGPDSRTEKNRKHRIKRRNKKKFKRDITQELADVYGVDMS